MWIYDMPMAATVGGVVFIALLYFIFKTKKYAAAHLRFALFVKKYHMLIVLGGLALLFAVQLILAKSIYYPIGWDCGAIVKCAVKGDVSSEAFYFSTYPNNLLMFYIFKYLLKAFFYFGGTNVWAFLCVVNIVMVDIAVYFVFVVCKKLFGIACGLTAGLLFVMIFGLSPWLIVPYSDTFVMPFCPFILWLFLKFQESKQVVVKGIFLFLVGFVSLVAYNIKPYTLIVLIAICLYLLVHSLNSIKKIGILILTLFVISGGAISSLYVYNVKVKDSYSKTLNYSQALPMSYFFMMGLNTTVSKGTGKTLYGAYSGEDNLYVYTLKTPEEKQRETLRVAMERIKKYTPKGYAGFLSNKGSWVFSDGSFWVEGEGYDVEQKSVSQTDLGKWFQSFFRFYGAHYSVYATFVQGIWVLLIFLLICPLFNDSGDYKKPIVNILRIAVFGFLLYELLFEARPRYIIAVLPVIIILSAAGFSHFHENFYSYQEEEKEKPRQPEQPEIPGQSGQPEHLKLN